MRSLIAWFVKNPIAANMLMVLIMVSGFFGVKNLGNEMFPMIETNSVEVLLPYPGAGSQEVEEQICIRIEEAVDDLEGVKEIRAYARQGVGRVVVEAISGWDVQRLLTDVKSRVDAIDTFPEDSERPIVSEIIFRAQVLNLAISGDIDEGHLKALAEDIKQDISAIAGVGTVEIFGARDAEVSVEISAQTLLAHQLDFDDIANAIRGQSINLPAGQVRNERGDIQIQTYGQAYSVDDFYAIPVISRFDGSRIMLGELARVNDGFEEANIAAFINKKPTLNLLAYVTEEPDFINVSKRIKSYVEQRQKTLPPEVGLEIWFNFSKHLESRLSLMTVNALQGLVLVYLLLMLFLRPILAFWVVVGLAIAYLGTFAAMSALGVTLSVVSSFAFIFILGIVVDDAIVVSESIYADYEKTGLAPQAAVSGGQKIVKPVVIAVVTTMMVFIPILLAESGVAQIFSAMGFVAVAALSFSLVESFLILPSHLSHMQPEKPPANGIAKVIFRARQWFSGWFNDVLATKYQSLLHFCLQRRALTVATFSVGFAVVLSIFAGGWIKISFNPDIESEQVRAFVTLKEGEGVKRSNQIKDQLVAGVDKMITSQQLVNDQGVPLVENVLSWVIDGQVFVVVGLISNEQRDIGSAEIARLWRDAIGEIKGVEDFNLVSSQNRGAADKDISLQLRGNDSVQLEQATEEIARLLGNFDGVREVSDSLRSAQREITIELKPYASTLGISLADVARQVRYAFYGVEVQRIPRLRDDVRVLVRYPAEQRQNISVLEDMWLRTADGENIPFNTVASVAYQTGYSEIQRVDRQRVVDIKANVDKQNADAKEIVDQVFNRYWPELNQRWPGLSMTLSGEQQDEAEFGSEMTLALSLVLLAVYTLLAVEFKSYLQPVIIMSAIPFGLAGGIVGHLLLGYAISMLSVFGFLATAGVVVNDNLVLLDRINRLRDQGLALQEAIQQAGRDRLRPIFLTSLTTFFGLTPILFSDSQSSKFLKPMVTSLSFGVVLASLVTVILVPVLYSALEQFKINRGLKARAEINIEMP